MAGIVEYMSKWAIDKWPEIRITDGGDDNIVMHVYKNRVLYPIIDKVDVTWLPGENKFSHPELVLGAPTSLARFYRCRTCKRGFTSANVKTHLGWKETQISGTCETCWDDMFKDSDEEEEDAGFNKENPQGV
jgi:hypothetical protein